MYSKRIPDPKCLWSSCFSLINFLFSADFGIFACQSPIFLNRSPSLLSIYLVQLDFALVSTLFSILAFFNVLHTRTIRNP
ncbi:hypothetical protein BY458DRAFT_510329 [Sporodiniella umbellata]|nr:hypothetical protein BY458DRAFT_510329 [Sporodiniella umbellata]